MNLLREYERFSRETPNPASTKSGEDSASPAGFASLARAPHLER